MSRILVIDQYAGHLNLLTTQLANQHHDVRQTAEDSAVLAIGDEWCPDLIITNLVTPTTNGYTFAQRLRDFPSLRDVAVVFATDLPLDRARLCLAEASGARFLISPDCQPAQLQQVVARAIADGPCLMRRPSSCQPHLCGLTELAQKVEALEACNLGLRFATAEAEQSNLAKSKFLAAASHDLRQPMQSLMLLSGTLDTQVPSEGGRKILSRLEDGLHTLSDLLDHLLDLSQIESGALKADVERLQARRVIEQVVAPYMCVAAQKGLEMAILPGCDVAVRTDAHLLGRMLRNLIENAVRYTDRGRIWVDWQIVGDRLQVSVHDTGRGIPADQQQMIFEEFHQVANAGRDPRHGLGLGLAIVKRLSVLLDHPIEVRSSEGAGSVFTIAIPLADTRYEVPSCRTVATAPQKRQSCGGSGR